MASRLFNLQNRINVLKTVLSDGNEEQRIIDSVDRAFRNANGELTSALSSIEQELSESKEQKQKASELLPKISWAYSVADLSEDNEALVRAISLGTGSVIASNIFSAT